MADVTPPPPKPQPAEPDPAVPQPPDRPTWLQRRRDKLVAEIQRNRQGGHKVPTWVLTLILVAFVAAWASIIIFA